MIQISVPWECVTLLLHFLLTFFFKLLSFDDSKYRISQHAWHFVTLFSQIGASQPRHCLVWGSLSGKRLKSLHMTSMSRVFPGPICGTQQRERICIILTFSHAKQQMSSSYSSLLEKMDRFGWWLTQFKQSHFRSARLFCIGICFFFSSLRAILGCLVRCVAACFYHLRAGVSGQSWELTRQEAAVEEWQQGCFTAHSKKLKLNFGEGSYSPSVLCVIWPCV